MLIANVNHIIFTPRQDRDAKKVCGNDSTSQGKHKSRKRTAENDEQIVHPLNLITKHYRLCQKLSRSKQRIERSPTP